MSKKNVCRRMEGFGRGPLSQGVIRDLMVKMDAQINRLEDSRRRIERMDDGGEVLGRIERNIGVMEEMVDCVRGISRRLASSGLNGMSNREARKLVNSLLQRHTKGFFNDSGWSPIRKTFKELERHGVDYSIVKSDYGVSKNFQDVWSGPKWRIPNDYKQWDFKIEFVNDRGRQTVLHGSITAHGAGSVDDPLERYDVTAYAG